MTSKPAANDDRVRWAVDSEYVSEMKQVKAMVQKLSTQEKVESQLRMQEEMIERLSTQLEELTRRLAKPESN